MKYDFDRIIDRKGTNSLKWEYRKDLMSKRDIIPLWVADMDFEVPLPVRQAIQKRAAHEIFGYTLLSGSYYQAVRDWMERRFSWKVDKKWIVFTPGVVPAVNFAVQAFSRPGEKIIIQPPVYYPFRLAVENNGRKLVNNPLKIEDGRWVIDYEHLESVIDRDTRMLILCSPHNPVGRVWKPEELERLAEICLENKVLIISDEIHADLVLPPHVHTPTATLSAEIADITIGCTSPNKTFNTAGLQVANNIIPNKELRTRFQEAANSAGIELANAFGATALEASYTEGEAWLEQLLAYIQGNYSLVVEFMQKRLPGFKVYPLEGTYLAWLDGRAYREDDKRLKDHLLRKARVWLDEGSKFGPGGEGFLRMNIALPRPRLKEALERMALALA
jgi:cystathionine beta-lyase